MLNSTKNRLYKKLLDLILRIQGAKGFFYYDGYYCNLEKMDNDYAVYVSYFQKKEYFGLYQNVFQIESKQEFKILEAQLLETRNKTLDISENEFFNFLKNYGEYKIVDNNHCYEIKYDDWNYIRVFLDYGIKYCKSEGDELVHGETTFKYGVNMMYETMFLYNAYRAKYLKRRTII